MYVEFVVAPSARWFRGLFRTLDSCLRRNDGADCPRAVLRHAQDERAWAAFCRYLRWHLLALMPSAGPVLQQAQDERLNRPAMGDG